MKFKCLKNTRKSLDFVRFFGLVLFSLVVILGGCEGQMEAEVLPRPDYDNSFLFSIYSPLLDKSEDGNFDVITERYGNGIYAPLLISVYVPVYYDWNMDTSLTAIGLQNFKDYVLSVVQKAKLKGVGIHFVLTFGLSRDTKLYRNAVKEDIRNAQWFNDNNLASREQLEGADPSKGMVLNNHVFGTLSRYARKLRAHLETKAKAAMDYLKVIQNENPDMIIIVSAPGEPELNFHRDNASTILPEFYADYSPFSIMEFRDWILHAGLYADGAKYGGEGYSNGGGKYWGKNGLMRFNTDFETAFTTWNLKYYHWLLVNPVDTDYTDTINPDPRIIPFNEYSYDGMMPTSGSSFIEGGFDAPREIRYKGEDRFWDLWQEFREIMVYHFVKDIAVIARKSGFTKNRYFSHQIPADYLDGTKPDDPASHLSSRYYSSASPLWAANAFPDMGLGTTIYDTRMNSTGAVQRTSLYSVPAISAMNSNWGAMEYNPEVIDSGKMESISDPGFLFSEVMKLYEANAHMIGFFKWTGDIAYRFEGTNRELALRQFFNAIKDKARKSVDTVFIPPAVSGFSGHVIFQPANSAVQLTWSPLIWSDLKHQWLDWGDLKEFIIYRGTSQGFPCDSRSEIARTRSLAYTDTGFSPGSVIYYKIVAVNVRGEVGEVSVTSLFVPLPGSPILQISKKTLTFGGTVKGMVSPPQYFSVMNAGEGVLNWKVRTDVDWIRYSRASGQNNGVVTIYVDIWGKTPGTYTATVVVYSEQGGNTTFETLSVIFNVYDEGQDSAPFGAFDSPDNGGSVDGTIAFSGWVVDDIECEDVKIYLKRGTDKVFLGDAELLENARPDIERDYPGYPGTKKSGWGFMLLTRLLPDQGNGVYKFYAIARDKTGHETMFQSRVLFINNNDVHEPFGVIDTPSQDDVSGKQFINWGWALTPSPHSLRFDGANIYVYIDGVMVGHPVYNLFREDVAALFPDCINRDGAGGYFTFDSTPYADGLHSISWSATNSAGISAGFGNKYFSIRNNSRVPLTKYASGDGNGVVGDDVNGKGDLNLSHVPLALNFSLPLYYRKGLYESEALNSLDLDNQNEVMTVYPEPTGIIPVEVQSLERIVIALDRAESLGEDYKGFLYIANEMRPLPIGSYLNPRTGYFYWIPGAGYFGDYHLIFIKKDKTGQYSRMDVMVSVKSL